VPGPSLPPWGRGLVFWGL